VQEQKSSIRSSLSLVASGGSFLPGTKGRTLFRRACQGNESPCRLSATAQHSHQGIGGSAI
jgi:hypothetical protein